MTSNPGPDEPVDKTSFKGKGRPKGTPKKEQRFQRKS